MPHKQLPIIRYAKQEIGGILARPDSRAVMRKAIEGHPIEVTSGNGYINLYHVFERMVRSEKSLKDYRAVRKQIGHSRWLMFVLPPGEEAQDVELLEGYDPKRGRYKRYAEQLAAGESVDLQSKSEAIKARRAWQLYVEKNQRKHLRSTIVAVPRTARFRVEIRRLT